MAEDLKIESNNELDGDSVEGKLISDIDRLTTALNPVRVSYNRKLSTLKTNVIIFSGIAIILSLTILLYYYKIFHGTLKPDFSKSSFEITYDIGVRVAAISLIISVIAFCLKMMRVYLALCEQIRHKITIIESMPALVRANEDRMLFKTSYNKIVEIIIQMNPIDVIGKEEEIKIDGLIEIIKNSAKKDK